MNNGARRPNASKQIMNKFKPKIRRGLFNNQTSEEATCNDALFSVLFIIQQQEAVCQLDKALHKLHKSIKGLTFKKTLYKPIPSTPSCKSSRKTFRQHQNFTRSNFSFLPHSQISSSSLASFLGSRYFHPLTAALLPCATGIIISPDSLQSNQMPFQHISSTLDSVMLQKDSKSTAS